MVNYLLSSPVSAKKKVFDKLFSGFVGFFLWLAKNGNLWPPESCQSVQKWLKQNETKSDIQYISSNGGLFEFVPLWCVKVGCNRGKLQQISAIIPLKWLGEKPQCEYSEKRLWFYDITFPPALCVSISPLLSSPLGLNLFRSVPPAGHDFCSEGHSCMEHSDCVNLEAGDCCVCKDGFRPLRDDNAYCEGRAKPWLLGEVYGLWNSGCGFIFVNMPKLHHGGHKRALGFCLHFRRMW